MAPDYPGGGRPVEELRRVSRILEIAQMIAVRPRRYRRRDLADRFEISERMVQKDIAVIRHGLKLDLCAGPEGYFFDRLPRLPALRYDFSQALSLLLAVQAAGRHPGIDTGAMAEALSRIEVLFPPEFLPLFKKILPGADRSGNRLRQTLSVIGEAVLHSQKIRMVYRVLYRGGDRTERTVHPYCLYPHLRSWHMMAYCELRERVRIFKIDRIEEASILEETFRLPADFSPANHLAGAWGIMKREGMSPEKIVLEFDEKAGTWVAEDDWHETQQTEPLTGGGIRFTVEVDPSPDLLNWILSHGRHVKVVEPERLKRRVKGALAAALERYEHRR